VFISRRSHDEVVASKEAAIAALKSEVQFLRNLVRPVRMSIDLNHEANKILDGHQEPPSTSSSDSAEVREILSERDRLLSGTY
jgi:hypothetical protein